MYNFPWVEVEEGVYAWDGGLLSNTPLREVIDASPVIDKKIFLVENYPKRISSLPDNLAEVYHRTRDIIFCDKTLSTVQISKAITRYLRYIDELYQTVEQYVLSSERTHNFKFTCNHNKERGIYVSLFYQQFAS